MIIIISYFYNLKKRNKAKLAYDTILNPNTQLTNISNTLFPLKIGSKNDLVKSVQIYLNLSLQDDKKLTVDGIFGNKTLLELQLQRNISEVSFQEYNSMLNSINDQILINMNTLTTVAFNINNNLIIYLPNAVKKSIEDLTNLIINDIYDTPFSGHNYQLYSNMLKLDNKQLMYLLYFYKNKKGKKLIDDLKNEYFLDVSIKNTIISKLEQYNLIHNFQ
jgi:hypothetical protein